MPASKQVEPRGGKTQTCHKFSTWNSSDRRLWHKVALDAKPSGNSDRSIRLTGQSLMHFWPLDEYPEPLLDAGPLARFTFEEARPVRLALPPSPGPLIPKTWGV